MIIRELMREAADLLTRSAVESPAFEAGLLLSYALSKPAAWLYAHSEDSSEDGQAAHILSLVKRRCQGEPMAYITGECEFMSLKFHVNPNVLIPRADTELLVEAALDALGFGSPYFNQPMFRLKLARPARLLDIGTGSGCLAVSLAKLVPGLTADGVDISPDALETARRNAERHGVSGSIRFLLADFLKGVPSDHEPYDLIISNPPYIALHEKESLMASVRDYEPSLALYADDGGLAFYRKMASGVRGMLAPGGILLVECGYSQASVVADLFRQAGMEVLLLKDLAGIERAVTGYFPS